MVPTCHLTDPSSLILRLVVRILARNLASSSSPDRKISVEHPLPIMNSLSDPSVVQRNCFSFLTLGPLDPTVCHWCCPGWAHPCSATQTALPGGFVPKNCWPAVWDKRHRGHGENPALTFIQETRWVAPGSGCQPCKAGDPQSGLPLP